MCFNKNSSIVSYFTASLLAIILFNYGDKIDKHIALFSLVFIQMQLVEYFMWKDQKCGSVNHYASIFGNILLLLQPVSVILFGIMLNTFSYPRKYLYILLLITIIPLIFTFYRYVNNTKRKLCTKEQDSGHLEWEFIEGKTENWNYFYFMQYFVFLSVPWLLLNDKVRGLIFFLLLILSYAYQRYNFAQWESKWCYYAVQTPLIFLVLLILRNMKLLKNIKNF
jgi:hypothetical protein